MFVFVAVLLGVASISLASDCASDPNECTPKGLCEVATELTNGNKLWSSAATSSNHVSFAQELGMNCGVVELKDPCDTDPNECKIKQLCEKATLDKAGTKSWNIEAEAYVVVAEKYGLSCDVVEELKAEADKCKGGNTKNVKCRPKPIVPSDEETQVSESCSSKNTKACSDKIVCQYSTLGAKGRHRWDTTKTVSQYVSEAKRRGLTCELESSNKRKLAAIQAWTTLTSSEGIFAAGFQQAIHSPF